MYYYHMIFFLFMKLVGIFGSLLKYKYSNSRVVISVLEQDNTLDLLLNINGVLFRKKYLNI